MGWSRYHYGRAKDVQGVVAVGFFWKIVFKIVMVSQCNQARIIKGIHQDSLRLLWNHTRTSKDFLKVLFSQTEPIINNSCNSFAQLCQY